MTTLTIKIPDNEEQEVLNFITQKGRKVVEEMSSALLKRSQKASLKNGLIEAVQINRGEIEGKPLSELWDEVYAMELIHAEISFKTGWNMPDKENEYWNGFIK